MKDKFLIAIYIVLYAQLSATQGDKEWTGRYFPETDTSLQETQPHNGIPMGTVDDCDDGKSNLEVDYSGSAEEYTCFDDKQLYLPNRDVHPVLEREHIPLAYSAPHYCMNESIAYKHPIPSFGGHRPCWPKYGEYKFVPTQRWLHSLEHGAVVMLYHPCANYMEIKHLKDIVRNCLYRHIITANSELTPERPLALLTWGNKLLMSKFDSNIAIKFIKGHANRAPEKTAKNGEYSFGLTVPANKISNDKDNVICEKFIGVDRL